MWSTTHFSTRNICRVPKAFSIFFLLKIIWWTCYVAYILNEASYIVTWATATYDKLISFFRSMTHKFLNVEAEAKVICHFSCRTSHVVLKNLLHFLKSMESITSTEESDKFSAVSIVFPKFNFRYSIFSHMNFDKCTRRLLNGNFRGIYMKMIYVVWKVSRWESGK